MQNSKWHPFFVCSVIGTASFLPLLVLPAMVGANLLLFTFTGFCPMAILLHSLGMPEGKRC